MPLMRIMLTINKDDLDQLTDITRYEQAIDPAVSRNMLIRNAIRDWLQDYKQKRAKQRAKIN